MMNRFATYKSVAKRLWDSLSANYKVVKSAYADVVGIEAISKTMEISDLPIVRDCIAKYKALHNNP